MRACVPERECDTHGTECQLLDGLGVGGSPFDFAQDKQTRPYGIARDGNSLDIVGGSDV